jgi:dolichol-phosphate mannosyltransferase
MKVDAVALLAVLETAALFVVMRRLAGGRTRKPAVAPRPGDDHAAAVSVVVPTLNEGARLEPCLRGLAGQGPVVREIIVVDSGSTDRTRDLVARAAARDPRFRVEQDPPLADGWIGKVWALQHALSLVRGEWVLGVDADVEPRPRAVAGALDAAIGGGYDVVSFAPSFGGQTAAEQWLQASLLATLVYRVGAAGADAPDPERTMANGQFFLAKRHVLAAHGGYAAARQSFSDDVTLARHLARAGVRVGFLDGSRLYVVRAYTSAGQMWREWGRSIDLRDSSHPARHWLDVAVVTLAQGVPWFVLLVAAAATLGGGGWRRALPGAWGTALAAVGGTLLAIRLLLLLALRGSYERVRWTFWLSPLADPLAVVRLWASSLRRPAVWRGRRYA